MNYLHKYKFYFKYPTKGLPILSYSIKGVGINFLSLNTVFALANELIKQFNFVPFTYANADAKINRITLPGNKFKLGIILPVLQSSMISAIQNFLRGRD